MLAPVPTTPPASAALDALPDALQKVVLEFATTAFDLGALMVASRHWRDAAGASTLWRLINNRDALAAYLEDYYDDPRALCRMTHGEKSLGERVRDCQCQ